MSLGRKRLKFEREVVFFYRKISYKKKSSTTKCENKMAAISLWANIRFIDVYIYAVMMRLFDRTTKENQYGRHPTSCDYSTKRRKEKNVTNDPNAPNAEVLWFCWRLWIKCTKKKKNRQYLIRCIFSVSVHRTLPKRFRFVEHRHNETKLHETWRTI